MEYYMYTEKGVAVVSGTYYGEHFDGKGEPIKVSEEQSEKICKDFRFTRRPVVEVTNEY